MFGSRKAAAASHRDVWLSQLSAKYREPLRRYFYRRVGSHDEAEDLTQELFVRMVRKRDLASIENAEAFLFQTAGNLFRDRQRRNKTSQSFMAEMTQTRSENFEALSPERVLESRQALDSVLQVLNGLDERSRDVFILHRLEGLKYAEIAQLYGISVSSVEKYIIKCLAHLARHTASLQE